MAETITEITIVMGDVRWRYFSGRVYWWVTIQWFNGDHAWGKPEIISGVEDIDPDGGGVPLPLAA